MSKNIKEIGKELLGKSLNSFHRKTGLTQLEKNNEMQDGILNGILSQVDDAYIEKTEQSNVIHLEGSGDGVVALDSIEGNTMVNLATVKTITLSGVGSKIISNITRKINTVYTLVFDVTSNTATSESDNGIYLWTTSSATVSSSVKSNVLKGRCVYKMTSTTDVNSAWNMGCRNQLSGIITIDNIMILEGDWTNKEIPPYFEGLQSSFEENITDEGKYEIEILSHKGRPNELKESYKEYTSINPTRNEYLGIDITDIAKKYLGKRFIVSGHLRVTNTLGEISIYSLGGYNVGFINPQKEKFSNWDYKYFEREGRFYYIPNDPNGEFCTLSFYGIYDSGVVPCVKDIKIEILDEDDTILATEWCPHYEDDESYWLSHKNSNKIKLLINEPLRSVGNVKDRLCVKDNKLMIERNCVEHQYSPLKQTYTYIGSNYNVTYFIVNDTLKSNGSAIISDKLISTIQAWAGHSIGIGAIKVNGENRIIHSHEESGEVFLSKLNSLLPKYVYVLAEPYYEEVLNEYGEPILLEGYENGTIYIDSTIVPNTTVRYTPKMESLNTLKEVNNNNVMLTNDINDMIVPYMMEVDLMIMEKEVALMSQKNIRKIGEKDMTNMQKRTYDMLARLIKGKTLNEQECKTRVTVYLNAGKITDEQAKELNFLIDEIYA